VNSTSFFNDHIVEDRPIGEQPGECRMELELNKLGAGKMEFGLDRQELELAGRKELGQHRIVVEELHSWTWASWRPLVRHSCPLVSWLWGL
jgi:hypothetical protein